METEMLRPLMFAAALLGAVLLAIAPAAFAGERVIEVWNPPEARQGAHLIGKTTKPPHHRKVLAHRSTPTLRQHQVTQQASQQAAQQAAHSSANHLPSNLGSQGANESTGHAAAPVADAGRLKHNEVPPPKHDISRFDDIPRIVTPEGNVLRVGTDGATAQVAR
jgi:hypothetical protein